MNYCTFIVKILKKPEKSYFDNNIAIAEVPVKFYQSQNSNSYKVLNLTFWGNLANDIVQYYQINDYIIIEGYISFHKNNTDLFLNKKDKQIEISVFKIYPYLLNISQVNKSDK